MCHMDSHIRTQTSLGCKGRASHPPPQPYNSNPVDQLCFAACTQTQTGTEISTHGNKHICRLTPAWTRSWCCRAAFFCVWRISSLFHWRPPAEEISPAEGGGQRWPWITAFLGGLSLLAWAYKAEAKWIIAFDRSAVIRGVGKTISYIQFNCLLTVIPEIWETDSIYRHFVLFVFVTVTDHWCHNLCVADINITALLKFA